MKSIQNKMIDFSYLGKEVEDKVTGFKGIVTSLSYTLYGCVQAIVHPKYKENDKAELQGGNWFDTKRLRILCDAPVMEVPDFTAPDYSEIAGLKGGNGSEDYPAEARQC
jgi:hypothetical protein